MGDGEKASLRLQFNPKVRLAFHGATITTDAGLLAFREFDDALGLTEIAEDYLQESRTGRNILHHLVPLLRQSIYSRLAGYDDTNDAVRLSQDPAMRVIVGWQGSERKGASTSELSWIWIVRRVQYTVSRRAQPITATSNASAIILSFCSTSSGIVKERSYGQATSTVPMIGKKSSMTSRVKGYPFEVILPTTSSISGVVLADQVKSLDWWARRASFESHAPRQVVGEALEKISVLLFLE